MRPLPLQPSGEAGLPQFPHPSVRKGVWATVFSGLEEQPSRRETLQGAILGKQTQVVQMGSALLRPLAPCARKAAEEQSTITPGPWTPGDRTEPWPFNVHFLGGPKNPRPLILPPGFCGELRIIGCTFLGKIACSGPLVTLLDTSQMGLSCPPGPRPTAPTRSTCN